MIRFCVMKAIRPLVNTRQKMMGSNEIDERILATLLKKVILSSIVADIIKFLYLLSIMPARE